MGAVGAASMVGGGAGVEPCDGGGVKADDMLPLDLPAMVCL